jgi:hypothetical protein
MSRAFPIKKISGICLPTELSQELLNELQINIQQMADIVLLIREGNATHICSVNILAFNNMFPSKFISANNFYFCDRERKVHLPFDIDSELAKKIISQKDIEKLKYQNTYNNMISILTDEQKTKYCLMFDKKVCHEFNTIEEAEQKIEEDGINYILCSPPRRI